jgi:hypothetical protein
MKASMWALSSSSELNEAPRSALPVRIENQISTWLSQDARVGVKWKFTFGWRFQPAVILRLVRVEIVEDDMDLASSVLSDNPVLHRGARTAVPPTVCDATHRDQAQDSSPSRRVSATAGGPAGGEPGAGRATVTVWLFFSTVTPRASIERKSHPETASPTWRRTRLFVVWS